MPDSIDQLQAVADVYAAALFSVATESDAVQSLREELEEFVRLQGTDGDFAKFMAAGSIDSERRAASLEKLFRGRLSDPVLNMLLVMNRNGRSGLVEHVLRRFVIRQEAAAGEVEVTATSAVELTEQQRNEVTERAAGLSGRTPIMEWAVDPRIIGGLVLQIGDLRYDNSVQRQLAAVRSSLSERSQRGLNIKAEA